MTKSRIGLYIAVVAILAASAGVFTFLKTRKPAIVSYDTVKVERGRVAARVTATGTLSALVTVQVGSQVSGRLQQILVDYNSQVKKGDVIARLDQELNRAAVEQAKANYLAAQGNLAKAKAQALDADRQNERQKALFDKKLVAAADRDTAQANADAARAGVQAAEGSVAQASASLHQAQVNLTYCTIVSPIDGVVISRSVDVGQTVAASLQAPTLFTIAEDLKKMQVDTNVAEADVGKLSPGMAATFTVDAYPSEKFVGKVRQIRNAPQTVQNVVTYDAVIDVDNVELKLKPGMTANVTFVYADRRGVIRVPNTALRFKPTTGASASARAPEAPAAVPAASAAGSAVVDGAVDGSRRRGGAGRPRSGDGADGAEGAAWRGNSPRGGGGETTEKRTIWVLSVASPSPVQVEPGVSDGSWTEIISGDLHEGDLVITQVSGGVAAATATSSPAGAPAGGMMRRLF